jgi:hypothetical protein
LSLHGDDYKAMAAKVADWFRAHPSVAQFLGGVAFGAVITLIFTWG